LPLKIIFPVFFSFGDCNVNNVCLGNQAVYRVSFGCALIFFLIAFCVAIYPGFHYDYWSFKMFGYSAAIIVSFFIPNVFFSGYAEFARVVSIFFLVLQIVILIDFAYDLHEFLLEDKIGGESEVEENKGWKCTYLAICLLFFCGAITGCGVLYHYFGICDLHKFFISFTLVLGIISTFISIMEKTQVGLLVPSIVFAYCTYITWQSMYSNPDESCNQYNTTFENPGMVIVGIIITAISLTYTSWSAGVSAPNLFRRSSEHTEDNAAELDSKKAKEKEKEKDTEDPATPAKQSGSDIPASENPAAGKGYWFFHAVMAMGSVYMAMLLTNWGTSEDGGQNENVDVSKESMWIKIVSVWVTYVLFLWTITAPLMCSDREFGSNGNNSLRKRWGRK